MGRGGYTTLQWPIKEDYEFWSCNDPIEHWLTKSNINYCIVNAKDDSEQIFFLLPSEVIIWYVTAFWIVKVQSLQVFTFLPFNSKFSKPCQSSLLWQLWLWPWRTVSSWWPEFVTTELCQYQAHAGFYIESQIKSL